MSYSNIDWTLEGLDDSTDVTETETTVNENGDIEESKTTTKTVEEDKEPTESNDTSDTNDDDTDESSDVGEETQTNETDEGTSSDASVKTEETEMTEDVDSDEILTTMLEVNDIEEDINEDADTVENSITALEALQNVCRTGWNAVGTGGFDRNGAMLFNSSLEGFASILGAEKDFFKTGISLENFSGVSSRTSATIASLEGLGESIKKAWKRLLEFLQKSFEKVKQLVSELMLGIKRCDNRADKILEKCKEITDSQTRFSLDGGKYIKYLVVDRKIVTPFQAIMSTNEAINDIMKRRPSDRINKLIDNLINKTKNDIKEYDKNVKEDVRDADGNLQINNEDSEKEILGYIEEFMSGSSTNGFIVNVAFKQLGLTNDEKTKSYVNISKPMPLNTRYAEIFIDGEYRNYKTGLIQGGDLVADKDNVLFKNKTIQSLNKDEIIKLVDMIKKLLKRAEELNAQTKNYNEQKKNIKNNLNSIYFDGNFFDRISHSMKYLGEPHQLVYKLINNYDNPNKSFVKFIVKECNGLLDICEASLKANSKEDKKQD